MRPDGATRVSSHRQIPASSFTRYKEYLVFNHGCMTERRNIPRTMISKNAMLFFDEKRGVFACHVRDISNGGAGIQLHDLNVLPLNFELTFDMFHNIRQCKVI